MDKDKEKKKVRVFLKKKPNKREGEQKKNLQKINFFFNDRITIIIIKKGIRIRVFSPIKRSKAFFEKRLNV